MTLYTCSKSVDGQKKCMYCKGVCVKNGLTNDKKQRFLCRTCSRSFIEHYKNHASQININSSIQSFLKEGCGIRSISRILKISATTVLKRIKMIAKAINKPALEINKEYELDELCTFAGCKKQQVWVVYSIQKDDRRIIALTIGSRTNKILSQVTDQLFHTYPAKIYTDKLLQYKTLIHQQFTAQRSMASTTSNIRT